MVGRNAGGKKKHDAAVHSSFPLAHMMKSLFCFTTACWLQPFAYQSTHLCLLHYTPHHPPNPPLASALLIRPTARAGCLGMFMSVADRDGWLCEGSDILWVFFFFLPRFLYCLLLLNKVWIIVWGLLCVLQLQSCGCAQFFLGFFCCPCCFKVLHRSLNSQEQALECRVKPPTTP